MPKRRRLPRLAQLFRRPTRIGARIVPIWKAQSGLSGILASPMAVLGAACGLVLLIACANVANLLLARSAARQTEFGIRAALGAGPGRLSRQLVSESVLLAALATLGGFLSRCGFRTSWAISRRHRIAVVLRRPPRRSRVPLPPGLPGFRPDFRSSARISVGAAQRSGCAKQGGRGDTRGAQSRRISGLLVVTEVGLALAALVTLGLFLRSLYGLLNTPAGFDHRNVTVCRLFLSTNNYTPSEEREFSRRLRERLLSAPGVKGAAYSDSIPLGFGLGNRPGYGRRVCVEARREPGRASRLGVARLLRPAEVPLLAGAISGLRTTKRRPAS
jgi:hypothetical protein